MQLFSKFLTFVLKILVQDLFFKFKFSSYPEKSYFILYFFVAKDLLFHPHLT